MLKKDVNLTQSKLYIIPSPIGNLKDITLRTLETLKQISVLYCEDCRQTMKLLNALEIPIMKLVALHKHNEFATSQKIIDDLRQFPKKAGLIADAGTINVSDPGARLVELALKNSLEVIPLAGPSALATFLSGCGFNADHFYFAGFLPTQKSKLDILWQKWTAIAPILVVFYESPQRLFGTIDFFRQKGAHFEIALAKELTKIHETVFRGSIEEFLTMKDLNSDIDWQRGEICGAIFLPEIAEESKNAEKVPLSDSSLRAEILKLLQTKMSVVDIKTQLKPYTKDPKNLYKMILQLSKNI